MLKNKITSTEKIRIQKVVNSVEPELKSIFLSAFIEHLSEKDPNICKNIFNSKREKLESLKNLHEFEILTNMSFSDKDKADAIALFEASRKKRLKKVFDSSLKKAHIVSGKRTLKQNLSQSEEKVR